jgi:hypothetical protein
LYSFQTTPYVLLQRVQLSYDDEAVQGGAEVYCQQLLESAADDLLGGLAKAS